MYLMGRPRSSSGWAAIAARKPDVPERRSGFSRMPVNILVCDAIAAMPSAAMFTANAGSSGSPPASASRRHDFALQALPHARGPPPPPRPTPDARHADSTHSAAASCAVRRPGRPRFPAPSMPPFSVSRHRLRPSAAQDSSRKKKNERELNENDSDP